MRDVLISALLLRSAVNGEGAINITVRTLVTRVTYLVGPCQSDSPDCADGIRVSKGRSCAKSRQCDIAVLLGRSGIVCAAVPLRENTKRNSQCLEG
jgi:hypothetical protein